MTKCCGKIFSFHTIETPIFAPWSFTRTIFFLADIDPAFCPGDLLIIPAGKMHRPVIANEHAAYERMVLWITPQYLQSIDSPAGDLQKNLQKVGEHG